MPFEKGGRADKQGNRYEINCIIYELLKILKQIIVLLLRHLAKMKLALTY